MAGRFLHQGDSGPIEQIALFQEYDLDRTMLVPSYSALLTRHDTLTLDECNRLGMDTTRRVFVAREKAMVAGAADPPSLQGIIAEVFELDVTVAQVR